MNPQTIIAELHHINRWRRGDEGVEQPDPKHFGEVMDAAADTIGKLIASNTTLRRERGEALAEVSQLKGALALGQENCDAEYEALRREREIARDGLRDSAKLNDELNAELAELRRDQKRLDWLIAHSAFLSHSRDGEVCNVWFSQDPDDDSNGAVPAQGYPQKCYGDAREAVDAAMKGGANG